MSTELINEAILEARGLISALESVVAVGGDIDDAVWWIEDASKSLAGIANEMRVER